MRYKLCILTLMLLFANASFAQKITIIRHGQAEHNLELRYNSNPYHPNYRISNLTPMGVEQAKQTANKLMQAGLSDDDIGVVLVSPLPRTKQTAQALAEAGLFDSAKIKEHPDLIEVQMGELEGTPFLSKTPDWNCPENKFHGGEDRNLMLKRMRHFIQYLNEHYPQEHVVLVTHGTPSMHLIALLSHEHYQLQNAEAITLAYRE